MKTLLLTSFWRQITVALSTSAVLVATAIVIVILVGKPAWEVDKAKFKSWIDSGELQRCEALFNRNSEPLSFNSCEPIRTADILNFKAYDTCKDAIKRRFNSRVLELKSSGCPYHEPIAYSDEKFPPMFIALNAPEPLSAYALDRAGIKESKFVIWFAVLSGVFICVLATGKELWMEPNVGWRRLILVLSVAAAPVVPLLFDFDFQRHPEAYLTLGCLAPFAIATLLTFSRKIFLWVYVGFEKSNAEDYLRPIRATQPEVSLNTPPIPISTQTQSVQMAHDESAAIALANHRNSVLAQPLAGPWRRFWARILDVYTFAYPVGVFIAIFIGPKLFENTVLLGIVCLPFILLFEALSNTLFGNSPGKALLNIRVVTLNGSHLSFKNCYERLRGVYVYGLALGIPFVSLFPLIKGYQLLNAGRPTSYDAGKFNVYGGEIGDGRKFVAGIVIFILMSIPGMIGSSAR